MNYTVLVVEDHAATGEAMLEHLALLGYRGQLAKTAEEALRICETEDVDILLADLNLPGHDGIWLLEKVRELNHRLPVVMITGNASISTAVEATKKGAHDYIEKPVDTRRLQTVLTSASRLRKLSLENEMLAPTLDLSDPFKGLIGQSPPLKRLIEIIRRVAPTPASVLILGESGTGKELVANAIVALSKRAQGPYIKLNSAALPRDTLESELFGHVKGAFTGAIRDRRGRFELSHGGTLFLDEIGDMPPETQVKLLRVIQEGEFERVGGSDIIKVDVRIIAATNRNLAQLVAQGQFREDLYFRLNVIQIEVPALRERRGDIPLLANTFLKTFCGKEPKTLSPEAAAALAAYGWPGNVRELRNIMERISIIVSGETIQESDLPHEIRRAKNVSPGAAPALRGTMDDLEREAIFQALREHKGVKSEAARQLGIGLKTLYRKLEKYGQEGFDLGFLSAPMGDKSQQDSQEET